LEEPWAIYLGLWKSLLLDPPETGEGASSRKRLPTAGKKPVGSAPQPRVSAPGKDPGAPPWRQSLYDALMQAVLDALGNLDLRYTSVPPAAQPGKEVRICHFNGALLRSGNFPLGWVVLGDAEAHAAVVCRDD
jgi:hypothetical protein